MARSHHLAQYGLSELDYESMLESQGGLCAICREPNRLNGREQRLSVDHDHRTSQTRELLCVRCNTLLGLVRDSVGLLRFSIAYLIKHGRPDEAWIPDNPAAAEAREAEWQRTLDSSLNGQEQN